MFASIPLIALLVSSASALVLPRHRALARAPTPIEIAPRAAASQPATWASHHLEDYETYHIRYMALDCEDKHNTTFWDACCHPRAASNTTAIAAECTPSATALASASARYGDNECEETSSASAPAATPTATETEECSGEETSTAAPKSTAKASSSSAKAATSSKAATSAKAGAGALGNGPTTTASPTSSKAEPTTSTKAEPTTTSSKKAETSSSAKTSSTKTTAAAQPTGSVMSGGVATYYLQDGTEGACGTKHSDSDMIAAIDQDRYGNSDAKSSLCGKQVKITNTSNKKTVTVTIADDCPTCKNSNSIDLSKGAFTQIATIEEGEVDITWEWV